MTQNSPDVWSLDDIDVVLAQSEVNVFEIQDVLKAIVRELRARDATNAAISQASGS